MLQNNETTSLLLKGWHTTQNSRNGESSGSDRHVFLPPLLVGGADERDGSMCEVLRMQRPLAFTAVLPVKVYSKETITDVHRFCGKSLWQSFFYE